MDQIINIEKTRNKLTFIDNIINKDINKYS